MIPLCLFMSDLSTNMLSDTTNNTTLAFMKVRFPLNATGDRLILVQAIALFPEAQREAQRELDAVIGDGRLPEWSDLKYLPYVRSCVKETLRCMQNYQNENSIIINTVSRGTNNY